MTTTASATASATRSAGDIGVDVHDRVIGLFSRLRHHNTQMLETFASRWSLASSDVRAMYFLAQTTDATPKRIAEFLAITTGAMTSLVDRLERGGLAQRVSHPTDRRSIVVELTPRGRVAIGEAFDLYRGAFAAAIPDEDLDAASALFGRLADVFEVQTLELARQRA